MKQPKTAETIAPYFIGENGQDAYSALEQFHLSPYRWQSILFMIRAGKKEGTPELDDLQTAMFYLQRDIERVKKQTKPKIVRRPRKSRAVETPQLQTQPEAQSA